MRSKDFDEEEILKKAIYIFWDKGYNATSIHDLIDGLGIGRSSIYHTFGDKHQLFVKALEYYQVIGTAKITAIIDRASSVRDAIETLMKLVITDILNATVPKGCFKVNTEVEVASCDEAVSKLVYNDDLLIEDALYNAFKKAQANGEIDHSKDALALARFFCCTITGMRVYAKFRSEPQFFEDISRTALTLLD
jgi:TetR/AcrR family transcriptional repressor of nem operon